MSSRHRSYSPPRSSKSWREYSPPPLPRARSVSRKSVPKFTRLGRSNYESVSRQLYPPDGYLWASHNPYVKNRDWPAAWTSGYQKYHRAQKSYENSEDLYQIAKKHRLGREKVDYLPSLYNTASKRVSSPRRTGVYSYGNHRALREPARERESRAYDHVKSRTEHWNQWPRSSREAKADAYHYKLLMGSWDDYERVAADSREHDRYGARRRRSSFSTAKDVLRDAERREISFRRDRERDLLSSLPRRSARDWYY